MTAAVRKRLGRVAPYVVVLAIVIVLYVFAGRIDFVAPGGRIGPNFWPKAILILALITCTYEVVKTLFFAKDGDRELEGMLGTVLKSTAGAADDTNEQEAEGPLHPRLLWAGIALTILYLFAVEKLGFFLTTALYLGAFMWIGRYRRIGVIVATSLIGALAFVFVFMKIVYVSLPLGVEPFAQVSYLLMKLLAIR